jgi:cytochrome c
MTIRKIFAGAVSFAVVATVQGQGRAQGTRSVWDGVYTEAQALRGRNVYANQCSSCHGPDLMGGSSGGDAAPALAGTEFMTGRDGSTLGDLFDRIHLSMPLDSPGSLSRQESADLTAFLLASNKVPAGTTELATETTMLKAIKFAIKPDWQQGAR